MIHVAFIHRDDVLIICKFFAVRVSHKNNMLHVKELVCFSEIAAINSNRVHHQLI